jgi:hypothetical protein
MTKATRPVAREVQSRHGPLIVTVTSAGLVVRIKGKRTSYGPITWEQVFSLGAKLTADAAVADKQQKRRVSRGLMKAGKNA